MLSNQRTAAIINEDNNEGYYEHGSFPNTTFVIEILRSQRAGAGALPCELGLNKNQFHTFIRRYFPRHPSAIGQSTLAKERGILRQQLLDMRFDEWQDLQQLLIQHRAGKDDSEIWMAAIIAAACLGNGHLWRDLGLRSRTVLKQLLFENFPSLAQKNTHDMRWKKFLYRQLCEQQGHFICRSPSCDICPTYDECFGDES